MNGLEEVLTLQKFNACIDGLEHQNWDVEETEEVNDILYV